MNENLFKFFPYKDHDLDALANNYLWFSSYSDFNDPFEDIFINNVFNDNPITEQFDAKKAINFLKLGYANKMSPHEAEKTILDMVINKKLESTYNNLMQKLYETEYSTLKEYIKKAKASCFVRNNANSVAIKNKLMWSHYANGLRGFCVEYHYNTLIKGISERLGKSIDTCPITYGNLKRYSFDEIMQNTAKHVRLNEQNISFGTLVSLKSLEWQYENEYRLITDGDNCVEIPSSSIVSITLGEKMPHKKKKTLLSILAGNEEINCKVYEAYIDLSTFNLEQRFLCEI